ncbi:putative dual-specificity RNA methyltransferase RlmN [Posidoniimonas polymericola]|uniref:Probable dual-specificity RNA methyltransferase RlmN n=1 Tax=Posidoniimonas polymericola TaxID=2528002 RepID=A0A5C5ZDZ7_9BACT|nr:putative dual-specificity RNA methyltransferase RlmN [Posidoniimonas polymericola]
MSHLLTNIDQHLDEFAARHSLPGYRRKQIRQWLFEKRAEGWDAMSNLSKQLRAELAEELTLWAARVDRHSEASDGTEKLLVGLEQGGQIECVLLRDEHRRTMCVSTQVGCGMGCVFCASGLDGVDRNLTTGEIIEQFLRLQHCLAPEERMSHIVVMGMGEPLANLDALLPALQEATRPDGLGISHRRITISTVGLPKSIRRLAKEETQYRLAISLHAPDDELRNRIVPTNAKIGIDEIMAAADEYYEATRRRLTFEYVLLADLNDQPEHAHRLVRLLRGREAMINVIPYNPVAGLPYQTPSMEAQKAFRTVLEQGGLAVRFRHRKGDKINAACGQLRRSQAGAQDLVQLES